MRYRYQYCRSELACTFELPELPVSSFSLAQAGGEAIKVAFDQAVAPTVDHWVHHWSTDSGWTIAVGLSGTSYVLRLAEGESYLFNPESNTITLTAEPSGRQRNDLLNQVLPRVLDHQGRFLMHGSAVRTALGALSFVGASGWGKSTLAAALDRNGAELLSDDCMEFLTDGEAAICRPTYRSLRLWQDSAAAVPPSDTYQASQGDEEKRRFHRRDHPATHDLPLAAIYLLADPDQSFDQVSLAPMAPALAVAELLKHCFRLDPTDAARARSAFDTAADVVQRVPIFTLAYPRDFDRLEEVARTILEHASRNGASQTETI